MSSYGRVLTHSLYVLARQACLEQTVEGPTGVLGNYGSMIVCTIITPFDK